MRLSLRCREFMQLLCDHAQSGYCCPARPAIFRSWFLPSGTLAQPLALKIHAEQRHKNGIGLHPTSHLVLHEQDGYQRLWGVTGQLIGRPREVLTHADLILQRPEKLAAVVLELPMRELGGQLPDWDDLQAQAAWVHRHGITVHLDGARLWHCPAYYRRNLAEICALADSVYVSLYKDICTSRFLPRHWSS